jgi:hypothetical protein
MTDTTTFFFASSPTSQPRKAFGSDMWDRPTGMPVNGLNCVLVKFFCSELVALDYRLFEVY